MKKIIITVLLVITRLAYAGEITKEGYMELLRENQMEFESIGSGMTALNLIHIEKLVNGKKIRCPYLLKSVVVSVDYPKYQVYKKRTNLSNCGGEQISGSSFEYIEQEKIEPLDKYSKYLQEFGHHFLYSLENSQVTVLMKGVTGKVSSVQFKQIFDLGFSQFYHLIKYEGLVLSIFLIGRTWTDPASIELNDLAPSNSTKDI